MDRRHVLSPVSSAVMSLCLVPFQTPQLFILPSNHTAAFSPPPNRPTLHPSHTCSSELATEICFGTTVFDSSTLIPALCAGEMH